MISQIAISRAENAIRMQRLSLAAAFLVLLPTLLTAQDKWKAIPVETPVDHHSLPFIRAIGIQTTVTYKGEKRGALVIISGRTEATGGSGQPMIEVHIDGIQDLISDKDLELFEGPPDSTAQTEIRKLSIRITRGKQVYRAQNWVDLELGDYPESLVGKADHNNVFASGIFRNGPLKSAWIQLFHEMSLGFDQGHISIGGKSLSPSIEIDFSGNGIGPLLKNLLREVAP